MTDQSAVALVSLSKSWLQAPALETLSDCRGAGYDPAQRAYVLCATGAAPSFRIAASAERPIVNLCFVVRNWNGEDPATLQINSQVQSRGPNFRQGLVRDPNGRPSLVVWLQHQATAPTTFTLGGAKAEASPASLRHMAWAALPKLASGDPFAVTMTATALPSIGAEYFFEGSEGTGRGSGLADGAGLHRAGTSPGHRVCLPCQGPRRLLCRNRVVAGGAGPDGGRACPGGLELGRRPRRNHQRPRGTA